MRGENAMIERAPVPRRPVRALPLGTTTCPTDLDMSERDLCRLCRGFACDRHPQRLAVACGLSLTGAHGRKCLAHARQMFGLAARCYGMPIIFH